MPTQVRAGSRPAGKNILVDRVHPRIVIGEMREVDPHHGDVLQPKTDTGQHGAKIRHDIAGLRLDPFRSTRMAGAVRHLTGDENPPVGLPRRG